MKNVFSLLIFSFVTQFTYAQCDEVSIMLSNSNECLPLVVSNLQGTAPSGATVAWSWQANPGGAQLLYDEDDDFIVAIQMTQAGIYQLLMEVTFSDGTLCSELYEQEVFELPEVTTNLQSTYTLCDEVLETELSILNSEDFTSVNWVIGSEFYSDFTSTVTFEEVGTNTLTILTEDIHGCTVLDEVQFDIVEGPSYENTTVSLVPSISDLSCLEIASVHQLSTSVSSEFVAQSIFWIDTELTTVTDYSFDVEVVDNEGALLSYPLKVQFEECVLDYNLTHEYTVQHQSSLANTYDGTVLCEDQTITLTNTSPQLNWSSNFTWTIEGASIISETVNVVTFEYATDGDYNWTLNYNGTCASETELEQTVDVDILQPLLADGINQMSCLNSYTLDLSHATVLESDESYDFSWSIISASGVIQNSTDENPSFFLNEIGTYDVTLTISNNNTLCGETVVYDDFFTLGGLQVNIVSELQNYCKLDSVFTGDFILSPEVNQYDYLWTLTQLNEVVLEVEGYNVHLNEEIFLGNGTYSLILTINDSQSSCSVELELDAIMNISGFATQVEIQFQSDLDLCTSPSVNEQAWLVINNINNAVFEYHWMLYSGNELIHTVDGSEFEYDLPNSGAYSLIVENTDIDGCTSSDQIEITYEEMNHITSWNWQSPVSLCKGESINPIENVELPESNTLNVQWNLLDFSTNELIQSSSDINTNFVAEPGTYKVEVLLSSGLNDCEYQEFVSSQITLNENPLLNLTTDDLDVCELPHQLEAFAYVNTDEFEDPLDVQGIDYSWELSQNNLSLATGVEGTFNYEIMGNGVFDLKSIVTDSITGCSSSDSVQVVANDIGMTFEEEGPGLQCEGYMFTPQDYVTSDALSNVTYRWKLIDEEGEDYETLFVENPMFDIEQAGMYDLSVEVFSEINQCVFDTIIEDYIEIKPLSVSILTEVTSCTYPIEVTMEYDANLVEESETSFLWTFYDADGFNVLATSTEQNPTYEYQTEGQFDVELTLIDIELGCVAELRKANTVIIDSVEIMLNDNEPFISPCAPYSFTPSTIDLTVDFNGNYIYLWELIDLNGDVISSLNTKEGELDVNLAGSYDLQLTVINPDAQCTSIALLEDFVLVDNYELELSVVDDNSCFNTTDTVVKTINVDNFSSEYNFDNGELNYNWQVTPNTGVTVMSEDANQLVIGVLATGDYTISYQGGFEESDCTYSDEVEISIGVSSEIIMSNTVCLGNEFPLSQNTSIGLGTNTLYSWNSDSAITVLEPYSSTTSFIANGVGTHNISLTVTNDLGCTETVTELVEVYDVQADFTLSENVFQCVPNTVTLSSLNNDQVVDYTWNITENDLDGNSIVYTYGNSNVNHMYTTSNSTDVELIIEMEHGCLDTLIQTNNLFVNEFSLELLDLNDNYCFNGVTSISKDFKVNLLSTYDLPYTIESYTWEISSNEGVFLIDETDSTSTFSFDNTGSYSLIYSVTIDGCVYSEQLNFVLGVDVAVSVPNIICLGESFSISGNGQINMGIESTFEWTSQEGLSFEDANNATTNVVANQSGNYNLNFTVTNDEGCWITETHELEVYEVIADFTSPEAGHQCKPAFVGFESLNNDYISEFNWTIYEVSHLGDTTVTSVANLNPDYDVLFNQFATSDVELIITSLHGCSDTIIKEDYIEVVSPLPFVSLEPNWAGCDTIYVAIVDSSSYIDNFHWVDLGLGVILDYEVQDTNTVMYTYPYGNSNALYHEYYINLYAEYEGCQAEFNDTIRVYPNPILSLSASGFEGCPPFEVSFEDSSQFAHPDYSEFFWDFGDGETSNEVNPSHVYNQTGVYSVYHSVISPNGCFSDTLWETQIEVFEMPEASFTYLNSTLCFGSSQLQFYDTSYNPTDSLSYLWSFVDVGTSTEQDPLQEFTESAVFEVNLQVQDQNMCIDDTLSYIELVLLDTLVVQPVLSYVSVEDDFVEIEWAYTPDPYFDNLSLYHQDYNTPWNLIYNTTSYLPGEFSHDILPINEQNEYRLIQQDSCMNYSNPSEVHTTILLTPTSTSYQKVNLNWTPYIGWDEIEYYDIYRAFEDEEFEFVAKVEGDITSYEDTSLCNRVYSYYVEANDLNSSFKSKSNKAWIIPEFIDFSVPLLLKYTSVSQNDKIYTEWNTHYPSEMTYYKIDRWDDYFGWIENYAYAAESPFVDGDVGVDHRKYVYKISYADVCGNEGPKGRIGTNILLEASQFTSHYELTWSPYEDWIGDVSEHFIQYFNSELNAYQTIATVSGETFNYTDNELDKAGIDTSYCYRVVAQSAENPDYRSISNVQCFVPKPKDYFPNAFSPNNDGLNEVYKFEGNFAKEMSVEIYDKWGNIVFASEDVDFEWDGINQNSGHNCPQGAYVFKFEIIGFDNSFMKNEMNIYIVK